MQTVTDRPKLSVVIPVYGSAPILPELVRQLEEVLSNRFNIDNAYEVILVDDCGPGNGWLVIRQLADLYPFVKGVGLRKNVGQHNAIMAGLNYAEGDVVVVMDDDLQHSPYDVPSLYSRILEGYDVCYADFQNRQHALWKILGSKFNDFVASYLLKKPRDLYLSPFKAFTRGVRHELIKYTGPYVYLDGLILTITSRISTTPVTHHSRYSGEGGYGLKKSLSLWLKMATNFSIAPLRLASIGGMLFSLVGFLFAVFFILQKIVGGHVPQGWTSTIVVVLFMGGIQLLALGAIGEYLGRVYLSINRRPQYVVSELLNLDVSKSDLEDGNGSTIVRSAPL